MNKTGISKHLIGITSALTLAMMIPGLASAVPINVNGSIDTVFSLVGADSPFSVGDPITGSFDVDFGADNSFRVGNTVTDPVGSLSNFELTVGPATFALDTSDFTKINGRLSDDGSMLTQLVLDTYYIDVGLNQDYTLQVQNGDSGLLYVGGGPIIHGPITTTVGTNSTPVPEPGSFALLGFAILLVGVVACRQRSRALDHG